MCINLELSERNHTYRGDDIISSVPMAGAYALFVLDNSDNAEEKKLH